MLSQGEKQILRILMDGEQSHWEVLARYDNHINNFYETLKGLLDRGYLKSSNGKLSITEEGRRIANEAGLMPPLGRICEHCKGRGIDISSMEEAYNLYSELVKSRPKPISDFDQGYISIDGVMARVAYMDYRNDLSGSDVLVMGDDDLVSIAMAATSLPRSITVIEIDQRLIDFINSIAREYGFNIHAQTYDVRKDLPEEMRRKFDVFVTDPVETIPGIKLFLSRATSGLKGEGSAGYFGLTTLEASKRKWREIQRMLHEMNFVITDIIPKFSTYPMQDNLEISITNCDVWEMVTSLGGSSTVDADFYKSSLYRIELVDEPNPLVEGDATLGNEIYMDDESSVTAKIERKAPKL